MIRNLLALTGLLALALLSAATLQAQGYFDDLYEDEPPAREAVSTAGLDLSSPAGVKQLEARINAAIDRVCPDDRTRSLKRHASIRQCREDAVASVRPQVDRAIAAAEARERYAYRAPGRWRRHGTPPPERYVERAPAPDHRWRGRVDSGEPWDDDRHGPGRTGDRGSEPPPAPPMTKGPPLPLPPAPPMARSPLPPPPPGGRLARRTVVTTTTTTTTTTAGAPLPPTTLVETRILKRRPAGKWQRKSARTPAFTRRAAVAHSWLPPVAWAASDRATLRAFRTGRLVRWGLTDRNRIARSGYVTVSAARWIGGCSCRNVQVVKYNGRRQIVVASGMRCRAGTRLVNRAL